MIVLQRPEIESLVNFELAFEAVEKAYIAASLGQVNLPPVGHIAFRGSDADCHIKYGHIDGDEIFVIKVATGFPANSVQGLPTGNGLSLVMSATDGSVKALLHDEMWLTDVRTGIGGAIASHALARQNSETVLIVGTGIQAKQQIEAHAWRFSSPMRYLVWGRSSEKTTKLVSELSEKHDVAVVTDLRKACGEADIIVTTTGATEPLVQAHWIDSGTHITAVGSDAPGKQELEISLLDKANILVADSISQCIDHGEMEGAWKEGIISRDQVLELGTLLESGSAIRRVRSDISVVDLTGIAAQDIAIAKVVLASKAKAG